MRGAEAAPELCDRSGSVGQPENVVHRVQAGLAVARPKRGLYSATREDLPVLGVMGESDRLERPREQHAVIADHRATTQGRETDIATRARARYAVALAHRTGGKIDLAPFRLSQIAKAPVVD